MIDVKSPEFFVLVGLVAGVFIETLSILLVMSLSRWWNGMRSAPKSAAAVSSPVREAVAEVIREPRSFDLEESARQSARDMLSGGGIRGRDALLADSSVAATPAPAKFEPKVAPRSKPAPPVAPVSPTPAAVVAREKAAEALKESAALVKMVPIYPPEPRYQYFVTGNEGAFPTLRAALACFPMEANKGGDPGWDKLPKYVRNNIRRESVEDPQ